MHTTRASVALFGALFLACSVETTPPPDDDGVSIMATGSLSGCKGKASSQIPSDGVYVITTFGGATESQQMSCGSHTQNGSWYYAASRQRYGCGSKIKIEANGKCVVAQTDDYGPDVCVENAAGRAIIDVSPMVSQALFGTSGMGWSDAQTVTVTQTDASAQLGPCSGSPVDPTTGTGGTTGEGEGGEGGGVSGGGGSGGAAQCYCDDVCVENNDCCSNCGGSGTGGSGSGGSGSGGSGSGTGGSGAQCYCDDACVENNDCCAGCGTGSGGTGSGSGGSGGQCYCDAQCAEYGDCCADCP